jgi:HEAT repeat protein
MKNTATIMLGVVSALFCCECGDNGESQLKEISQRLKSPDIKIRESALYEIEENSAVELIPELIVFIKDDNESPSIRIPAIYSLCALLGKESSPEIIKLLTDKNNLVRMSAIEALRYLEAKESIPELIKLIKNPDDCDRDMAIYSLGKLGAKEAIPDLMDLLNSERFVGREYIDMWRARVAIVIAKLGVKEMIPWLVKIIHRYPSFGIKENIENNYSAEDAVDLLVEFNSREAIPELTDILKNKNADKKSRRLAALALCKFDAKGITPELLKLLIDEEPYVRQFSVDILGNFGIKEASSDIFKLVNDSDRIVRETAIFALAKLGDKSAIPELFKLIEDEKYGYDKKRAAIMLGEMGDKNEIPQLIKLMNRYKAEQKTYMLYGISYALIKLGAKEFISELIGLLKGNDSAMVVEVAMGLGDLGIEESIPELRKALKHHRKVIRLTAAISLVGLGEKKLPEKIILDMKTALYSKYYDDDFKERVKGTLNTLGVK